MKLPQVEARRRNQGLRRRHEARSWSDVDVWRSLFHSPLAMDKEEEVTGPARSLCAAVTSTGRPPRELRSQYGAEGRAGRTSQLDFSCRQSKHFFSLQNLDFSARRAQSSLIFCGLCWHLTSLSMSRQMSELEWFKVIQSRLPSVGQCRSVDRVGAGQTDTWWSGSCLGSVVGAH